MKVFLTGGRGFVGTRLSAMLRSRHPEWEVESLDKGSPPLSLDVTDVAAVEAKVRDRTPDIVIHLAAISAVTTSMHDPRSAWRVNFEGTLNLVSALQAYAPGAHLMFVSSAEVYGRSLDVPGSVSEAALLQPVNPYAASKAAADLLVRQAAFAGLSTSVMRAFNHTGPGQSEMFVVPSFAAQIARIEVGRQPPVLHTGDLDEERDFLDVEDVIEAYAAVLGIRDRLSQGEVFNVASGRALRVGDMLEVLLSRATVPIRVERDAQRVRLISVSRIVGDASHLTERTNWRPRHDFANTLTEILRYERLRLNQTERAF